jgi:hypothetical protein
LSFLKIKNIKYLLRMNNDVFPGTVIENVKNPEAFNKYLAFTMKLMHDKNKEKGILQKIILIIFNFSY